MLRPICYASQKIVIQKEFVRTKIVRPASILKPAEKLKLYNKENKDLFGPLIETKKQKSSREKKTAKNRSDQNNASNTKEVTQNITKFANLKSVLHRANTGVHDCFKLLSSKMWQNTRTCFNVGGVMLNVGLLRSIQTSTMKNAAKSWAAEPGYASEDRILQIKQYQTDYMKQYPSVTLILNKTMTEASKNALEKWKQERIAEMGAEKFNKFYEAQMGVGTKFHDTLKNYFTKPLSQLRIEKDVEGVWVSVSEVLKSISSPKAIESNVVHPVLKYRGIFDAIADYEDKPMLIEWKKSDKPRKSIAMTYDNPVQVAAYFGAVCNDLNYKHFNVRDALLVIAYTDGSKADLFHLTADKLRAHWAQWLIRLEEYVLKYGDNSEKRLEGGKRKFEEEIGNL